MNELIKVEGRVMGGEQIQTINARELHAFLESRQEFANWIKARIEQYGFVEEADFTVDKFINGRATQIDYHVSLDMAKELSMVERNEKGKQARQYFIECERHAKSNVVDLHTALADPASLRGMLLAYTEKVLALEAKVQEQAPKVEFHDAVAGAINCQSIQEVAKVLGTGQNRLFKFLRIEGILMPNNLPYQHHIDAGYFRVVEKQYTDRRGEAHTYTQTLVTGKGLSYIQKRLSTKLDKTG